MTNLLKLKFLKKIKRVIGLKTGLHIRIKRFSASASEQLRTAMIIKSNNIDCVIDVGANTGQFAESLYDFGFDKEIISFEPVSSCHEILLDRSSKNKKWRIADRCAIGDEDRKTTINVTKGTVFSSLLKTQDWHVNLKNQSKIVSQESVDLNRLDTIIDKYIPDIKNKRVLLKIDTQGYEKQVLHGCKNLLKEVIGIKIEIPLIPIYDNVEFTFYETMLFLEKHNFVPWSFNVEGVNLKTGRVNTIDGVFIKISK